MAAIFAVSTAVAWGMTAVVPPPEPESLADFDHAGHLRRGVECGDCHLGVQEDEVSAHAGVPSIATCKELCHGDFDDEARARVRATPAGRIVDESVARDEEPWWPALYTLPDHVVFSHRRHVALGEIPCETCHGGIAETTSLPRKPDTTSLTMDGCLACHRERGVTDDCVACHR